MTVGGRVLDPEGKPVARARVALHPLRRQGEAADSPLRATAFAAGDARPLGLGDPHPENFGTMRTRTGVFRIEPNDFDTADRVPYLWDVRRFAVGMCLAARLSNPTDEGARAATAAAAPDVVRATVDAYATAIRALAAGGARPTIESGG